MSQTIEERREKSRLRMARRRAENKESVNTYQRKWRSNHLERERAYKESYEAKYPGKIKRRQDEYRAKNREQLNAKNRMWQEKQRKIVLEHYGGEKSHCSCCGEEHLEFLTIDHINGGGNKHREEIGQGGLYRWLIKNNFPDGFRILCLNCNWSIGIRGYCPHDHPLGFAPLKEA